DEHFLLREHFVARMLSAGDGYDEAVQRVNYDRTMTGGLRLNAVTGANHFYVDDSSTHISIDAGQGSAENKQSVFQIGQLFTQDRLPPHVAAGDEIETRATTQGYLSHGNRFNMTIHGATHSANVFRVYSNAAPLALYGGQRDDAFMVYAFKENDPQANGERAYVLNSDLWIEGGAGVNTLSVLGSEEADAFALTQEGVRGAGLNTRYQDIQRINLDAREGNDHIYVLSTRQQVITTLVGGRGSDLFDLYGDVA